MEAGREMGKETGKGADRQGWRQREGMEAGM